MVGSFRIDPEGIYESNVARAALESDHPITACATCPSAVWYKTKEFHIFCNLMKFEPQQGIVQCDGREMARAKLVQAQRSKT